MFDDLFSQSLPTSNTAFDNFNAQFKQVKKINTFLDQYGLDPSTMERSQRFIDEWKTPAPIRALTSQIELPLKNLQKLFQSKLFPYGISGGLIAQIESQLKNSRKHQYSSYYSRTNRNYYRRRGTSSTQNNDYQSQERTSSQTASKSQTKEQNSSSQVTNKYKKSAAPKNKVVKLRHNATVQFKVLDEINSRVINNNNNPVEWSPSEWFGSGEGRRITDIDQSKYHNALTKLINNGWVKQEKPTQFPTNTGNAPTYVSLTREGILALE